MKKEDLLFYLKNKKLHKPFSYKEISKYLKIKGVDRKVIKNLLNELVEEGDLLNLNRGIYVFPEQVRLIKGKVSCHRDGYGFLLPEDPKEKDIFLPHRTLKDIYDGDTVLVKISERNKKREGEVVKILERGIKKILGKIVKENKQFFLVPLDEKLYWPLKVADVNKEIKELKSGTFVVGTIVDYPRNGYGIAKVDEVFEGNDYELEIKKLTISAGINKEYPKKPIKEVENLLKSDFKRLSIRKDLSKYMFVTIDGENAKDFDDAVFLKKEKNGFRLFVAIADVSTYVAQNGYLDREALYRGNSYYFPDRVYPMLPEILSNEHCSLRPDEEKLVLVAEMFYSKLGERISYDIYPGLIKSFARLTYEKVDDYLRNQKEAPRKLLDMLMNMQELTELLCAERFSRGSIDFDLPEPIILINMCGNIEKIVKAGRLISHRIVEEFMIAANRAVAEWFMENNIPTIYRVHEQPDPEKVKNLATFFSHLGYSLKDKITPKVLQNVLSNFRHTVYEKFVNTVVLRSMKQARYSSIPIGHFGLALKHYLHFTSPIRRYADLVVHRQLWNYNFLKKRITSLEKENERLEKIAESISKRERIAFELEREILDFAGAKLMSQRVGEDFDGIVSSVTPSGLYVELTDIFIEGFIPVENMRDDYYFFHESTLRLIGRRRKKIYHIGKEVKVKVVRVDINSKKIEFLLL